MALLWQYLKFKRKLPKKNHTNTQMAWVITCASRLNTTCFGYCFILGLYFWVILQDDSKLFVDLYFYFKSFYNNTLFWVFYYCGFICCFVHYKICSSAKWETAKYNNRIKNNWIIWNMLLTHAIIWILKLFLDTS